MTLYLSRKWCIHGRHEAPAVSFRPLPGVKPRREVCEACYLKIMAARARVKIGNIDAEKIPF
jgi:hypothetical protein